MTNSAGKRRKMVRVRNCLRFQAWFWSGIWLGAACVALTGCGAPAQQVAAKAVIESDGKSCNELASAIIQAGETCEGVVKALNDLVARDPKCQNVFHTSDPVATCKGQGSQPRKASQ